MSPRDVSLRTSEYYSSVCDAAANGNLPGLKALLGWGDFLTNGQVPLEQREILNVYLTYRGRAHPIQLAAEYGHMQTTLWLAQQCGCHSEQDVTSGLMKNTLHILAENGHLELLELLLRLPTGYEDTTLLFYQSLYQLGASDFDYYVIPERRALLFDERYFPYLVDNAIENGKEDVLVWFAQKDPDLFDECDEVIYRICRDCTLETIIGVLKALGFLDGSKSVYPSSQSALNSLLKNSDGVHVYYELIHRPRTGHYLEKINWMKKNFAQDPSSFLRMAGVSKLLVSSGLHTIKTVFESLGILGEDGLIDEAHKREIIEITISECEKNRLEDHIVDHILKKGVPSQVKETIAWLDTHLDILGWSYNEKLPLHYTGRYLGLAELKRLFGETGVLDSKGNMLPSNAKMEIFEKALTDNEGQHVLHFLGTGEISYESLKKIEWMVGSFGCRQRDSQGRTPLYEAVLHGELSQVKMMIDKQGCLTKEGAIQPESVKEVELLLTANDDEYALHELIKEKGDEASEKIIWLCQNLGVEWRDQQDISTLRLAAEKMSIDNVKEIVKTSRYTNQAGLVYPHMKDSFHELLYQRMTHLYEKTLDDCGTFYEAGEEGRLTEGANLFISLVKVFGIDYSPRNLPGYHTGTAFIPMLLNRLCRNFKAFLSLLDEFGFLDKNGNLMPEVVSLFNEQLSTTFSDLYVLGSVASGSLLNLWLMKQILLKKIECPDLKFRVLYATFMLAREDYCSILVQRSMLYHQKNHRQTLLSRSDFEGRIEKLPSALDPFMGELFSLGFSCSEMSVVGVNKYYFEHTVDWLSGSFLSTAEGKNYDLEGVAKLRSVLDKQSLLDFLIDNLSVETIRDLIARGDEVPYPTIDIEQVLETDTEKSDVLRKHLQAHLVVNSMCLHYLQRIEQELKEERPYSRLLHQLFDELIIAQSKWPMIDHVLFLPEVKQLFESVKDLMEEKELTPQFYLKWVLSSYAIYSPWAEPLLSKKQVIEDDRRYGWLVPSVEAVEVAEEAVEVAEEAVEVEEAEAEKVEPPTHNTTEYVRTVLEYSEAHPADFTTLATEVGDEKMYLLDEHTLRRLLCRAVDAEGEVHQLELNQSLVQLLLLTADRIQLAAYSNTQDFGAPPCKEYEVSRQATNRQLNQQSLKLTAMAIQLLLDSRPKERPESVESQPAHSELLRVELKGDAVELPAVPDFQFPDKALLTDAQFISEKINESDVLRNMTLRLYPLFLQEKLTDSPSSMEEESMEEEHTDKSAEEEVLFNHNNIHHVEKLLRCVAQVLNLEPAMGADPQTGATTSRQSGYVPRKKDCDAPLERPGVDSDVGVTGAGAAAGPGIRYRK